MLRNQQTSSSTVAYVGWPSKQLGKHICPYVPSSHPFNSAQAQTYVNQGLMALAAASQMQAQNKTLECQPSVVSLADLAMKPGSLSTNKTKLPQVSGQLPISQSLDAPCRSLLEILAGLIEGACKDSNEIANVKR